MPPAVPGIGNGQVCSFENKVVSSYGEICFPTEKKPKTLRTFVAGLLRQRMVGTAVGRKALWIRHTDSALSHSRANLEITAQRVEITCSRMGARVFAGLAIPFAMRPVEVVKLSFELHTSGRPVAVL